MSTVRVLEPSTDSEHSPMWYTADSASSVLASTRVPMRTAASTVWLASIPRRRSSVDLVL